MDSFALRLESKFTCVQHKLFGPFCELERVLQVKSTEKVKFAKLKAKPKPNGWRPNYRVRFTEPSIVG